MARRGEVTDGILTACNPKKVVTTEALGRILLQSGMPKWKSWAMCSETGHREPVREVPDRNRVPVESAGMADHVMENSKWRFPLKWADG